MTDQEKALETLEEYKDILWALPHTNGHGLGKDKDGNYIARVLLNYEGTENKDKIDQVIELLNKKPRVLIGSNGYNLRVEFEHIGTIYAL